MASASDLTFTKCRRCNCLCLGPTLLPCGHVTCRKCLREILENGDHSHQRPDTSRKSDQRPDTSRESDQRPDTSRVCACPVCGLRIPKGQGETTNELLGQFKRDVILERLVSKELTEEGEVPCQSQRCPNRMATKICLDCHEKLCEDCSEEHNTEDHTLWKVPDDRAPETEPDTSSADKAQAEESVQTEKSLMEGKVTELTQADNTVDSIISSFQSVKQILAKNQILLHTYSTSLWMTDITSYTKRLEHLRNECGPPSFVDKLEELKNKTDQFVALWSVKEHERRPVRVPREYRLDIQKADHVSVADTMVDVVVNTGRTASGTGQSSVTVAPDEIGAGGGPGQIQHVERLKVACNSTTINLDLGPVCVNQIPDSVVVYAVKDIVICKIDWASEMAREQELKTEKKHLVRKLKRKREEGHDVEEAQRQAQAELEKLFQKHLEEKQKGREKFRNFYMKIQDEKANLLQDIMKRLGDKDVLKNAIQTLFEEFDVRLKGVDTGMTFIMDTPSDAWETVQQQEQSIQKVLEDSLVGTQEVTWSCAVQCQAEVDTELRLGQPAPTSGEPEDDLVEDADEREENLPPVLPSVDSTPAVTFSPLHESDGENRENASLHITAVLATNNGQRLVLADWNNRALKVVHLSSHDTVIKIPLDGKPCGMALLQDGHVAVASGGNSLYIFDLTAQPQVVSHQKTKRQYTGVSAGSTPDELIVCWKKDDVKEARIDVISRSGKIIRTVIDSSDLEDMRMPHDLCLVGPYLYVSDWMANTVFRIELATGRLFARHKHNDMKRPHQITADDAGNLYIACVGSQCVLAMSSQTGEVKNIINSLNRAALSGEPSGAEQVTGDCAPWGCCPCGTRLAVAWYNQPADSTTVSVYNTENTPLKTWTKKLKERKKERKILLNKGTVLIRDDT